MPWVRNVVALEKPTAQNPRRGYALNHKVCASHVAQVPSCGLAASHGLEKPQH
ncbi:MAG: hypothetical protein LAO07_03530 [Acidobacteriia bacterium]|nr:hypothetical protein [Terriglobia bacterium]